MTVYELTGAQKVRLGEIFFRLWELKAEIPAANALLEQCKSDLDRAEEYMKFRWGSGSDDSMTRTELRDIVDAYYEVDGVVVYIAAMRKDPFPISNRRSALQALQAEKASLENEQRSIFLTVMPSGSFIDVPMRCSLLEWGSGFKFVQIRCSLLEWGSGFKNVKLKCSLSPA